MTTLRYSGKGVSGSNLKFSTAREALDYAKKNRALRAVLTGFSGQGLPFRDVYERQDCRKRFTLIHTKTWHITGGVATALVDVCARAEFEPQVTDMANVVILGGGK